ncbi:MAG: hypothetical protein D3921_05075 [Candidatus Electrothrix sp. AW1]|nr:hypothetical protein [Candidatus Electrothrix gigas]MCI5181878.1 hypothetical protein [Candidatus Electrothrix gigas]
MLHANLATLENILFWCMLINVSIMTLMFIVVISFRSLILKMHSKLFNVPESFVSQLLYTSLGLYKLLTFFFVVIPWIAVKLVSS